MAVRKPLSQQTSDSTLTDRERELVSQNLDDVSMGLAKELDPNAVRNFKTISIHFNEYEYERLKSVAKLTRRSLNGVLREGIFIQAAEVDDPSK